MANSSLVFDNEAGLDMFMTGQVPPQQTVSHALTINDIIYQMTLSDNGHKHLESFIHIHIIFMLHIYHIDGHLLELIPPPWWSGVIPHCAQDGENMETPNCQQQGWHWVKY